jgi:aerobic-type carbon monoxide dehydrogenase small subunit (CoxS/CutS family)
MPDQITVLVNGQSIAVKPGNTVATAVVLANEQRFRTSITGESRAPLCGMGICFECRVTINGQAHCRSCQIVCEDGMDITTGE